MHSVKWEKRIMCKACTISYYEICNRCLQHQVAPKSAYRYMYQLAQLPLRYWKGLPNWGDKLIHTSCENESISASYPGAPSGSWNQMQTLVKCKGFVHEVFRIKREPPWRRTLRRLRECHQWACRTFHEVPTHMRSGWQMEQLHGDEDLSQCWSTSSESTVRRRQGISIHHWKCNEL